MTRKPRVPAPAAPPPLSAMAARKAAFEAAREEVFPRWKGAIEAAGGNVSRAAVAFFSDLDPEVARFKGHRYTRRFGLVEYAASLRIKATGKDMGRPKGT